MKKLLLLMMLICSNVQSIGLNALEDNKPVIYVVNQNPIAAYYGSSASGFLARSLPDYQVYASYIKDDFASSEADKAGVLRSLVSDINRIRPKYVLIANQMVGDALKRLLPDHNILVFSYGNDNSDIQLEDPGARLVKILDAMTYEYDKIYILTDLSDKSKHSMLSLTKQLVAVGVGRNKIEEVRSRSTLVLEANLRSLNLKPTAVIVNFIYSLPDTEINKVNYLPDIKEILGRVNRKHLDVGFSLVARDNECVVLDYDLERIRQFIERGNSKILLEPLRLEASFNINRMNRLKMRNYYLRGISVVDEIIE